MMSLGRGVVTSLLRKQKLNVIIPNERKLVGTYDTMGTILWGE